jgi:hypothetical protein
MWYYKGMHRRPSNPEEMYLTAFQILEAATRQYIKQPKLKKSPAKPLPKRRRHAAKQAA